MRARLSIALRLSALAALALLASACGQSGDARPPDPPPSATPSSSAAPSTSSAPPAAPALVDPNPFKLPPRPLTLDAGKRVFTVSDQMLAGAKLGSTLVMYAATVAGLDGELLVIEGRTGPPYKVHPSLAIVVPDDPRIQPGDPVVAEHNGVMRHGVVKKHVKDRILVRYVDGESRSGESTLKATRFLKQTDGLKPGNYAALGDGETLRHVLLVSPFDDGQKKWFVLGAGGAAMIALESALEPIPVKFAPRTGTQVLAAHNGVLRKATVTSTPETGIFSVKYERAGRPATLGWGFLLPLANEKPKRR